MGEDEARCYEDVSKLKKQVPRLRSAGQNPFPNLPPVNKKNEPFLLSP